MKQLISILVLLVLAASLVSAQDVEESAEDRFAEILAVDTEGLTEQEIIDAQKQKLLTELSTLRDIYNDNQEQLPSAINAIFGDERMNVHLDGGLVFHVSTSDGLVSAIAEGEDEDPTVNIYVRDQVFSDLNADMLDLKASLKNEDISFMGVGFFKKAKFGVAKMVLGFVLSGEDKGDVEDSTAPRAPRRERP